MNKRDPYVPFTAKVVDIQQEAKTIFTMYLQLCDKKARKNFKFHAGQFNMLYLYGVGKVAISIVSDPRDPDIIAHAIRKVGRVTNGLANINIGDELGVLGPFGRGWPVAKAKGHDVVIVTGGLGCAPVVSVINYLIRRREQFGKIIILQGVKHSDDFFFKKQYAIWQQEKDVEVYIAADQGGPQWPFYTGHVTKFIEQLTLDPDKTITMMCGPEAMMKVAVTALKEQKISEEMIYLSMERNMHCGFGHCGHCQYGGRFACKDGPIFSYSQVKSLFSVRGF